MFAKKIADERQTRELEHARKKREIDLCNDDTQQCREQNQVVCKLNVRNFENLQKSREDFFVA